MVLWKQRKETISSRGQSTSPNIVKKPDSILHLESIGVICTANCCSVAKLCPTLCDPMDCSTPSLRVSHYLPEFAQVHVHWVCDATQPLPISKVKYLNLSLMYSVYGGDLVSQLGLTFATLWTIACQVPLSMGFLRQESWSGLPFPSPEHLPYPGIEPASPAYHLIYFSQIFSFSWILLFNKSISNSYHVLKVALGVRNKIIKLD